MTRFVTQRRMCEGTDSRCTTTVAVRGTRLAGRFEPLSFAYLYIPSCGVDPISCRHMDSQLVCLKCLEPAEKPERLSFSSS